MAITDWPADERPREKLLARGAAALSDAELLAIFLRVGMRGQSAVDLARTLLARFGTLTRMCGADAHEFAAVPGMGLAKYAQLQAVMELSRRALAETLTEQPLFDSPQVVRDWLRGTLTQTSVYPREVVKLALARNAAAVILAHNHPSGAAEPSTADEMLTRALKEALDLVDVRVLDHFVVPTHGRPVSFAERGLL
ncbi:JAB domain-containing protein [Thauera sp.]|uniref:JAB domain-containing protein n=1 Tax=Thauera sp. TaxID=1905334 RepID=UPI00260444A3|nr:JAB domain-containing protein [Thauera sp.]